MLKIIFKGLEKSQLATDIVSEKLGLLKEKFPDLEQHKIEIFLSMENSPFKSGRDEFRVKILLTGKKYGGIVLEKKNPSLYVALDKLILVMLEALNRKGDKLRVKSRSYSRKHKAALAL